MTCNLEKNKGVSVKSLPLGGEGASLQFVTLAGSEPGQLAEHAELLQKAEKSGFRWIGPEVYGSADLDLSPVPGAGMTAFLGTKTGASFYRGMQICAVEGINARAIEFNGRTAGVFYEDEYAEYAVLGGLSPRDRTAGRTEQTLDVFRQMEEALNRAGMDFSHVVRTWFYNNRLLDWYEEFNRARDTFFESRGVFDRLVPASTGIGSGNREHAALSARVFAIRPKGDRVTVKDIPSPLQCSAQDYRSSFSRAVEVDHPLFRQVIVSGTASIAPGGESVHLGDIDKQTELSLDVIEAILKSRGMGWKDVVRSVAYFKDKDYAPHYEKIALRRGLAIMPCIGIQADVCRDNRKEIGINIGQQHQRDAGIEQFIIALNDKGETPLQP